MTPEHRRQIDDLYHLAQERGRAALADADPELRLEVEKLLAHRAGSGTGGKLKRRNPRLR